MVDTSPGVRNAVGGWLDVAHVADSPGGRILVIEPWALHPERDYVGGMVKPFEGHVVLGAGGAIASALVPELLKRDERVVLVSRRGTNVAGTSSAIADVTSYDAVMRVVPEGSAVYLLVGLPYDVRVWREQWPRIMSTAIRVCSEKRALLVFFDNVYMYGLVAGAMTEETPYAPSSQKGEVRARIATQLMDECTKGKLHAIIARSADFYGPGAERTGIPNVLLIERLLAGKRAQWPGRTDKAHSLTYTTDCGRALAVLAADERAYDQVWHMPTARPPLTVQRFIELAAMAIDAKPRSLTLPRWMIGVGGLFDRTVKELGEMLYQNDHDYVFDSTKFERHFGLSPTPYERGIVETVEHHRAIAAGRAA
jgi:nucleoside-diphosphate-sugar epimerase